MKLKTNVATLEKELYNPDVYADHKVYCPKKRPDGAPPGTAGNLSGRMGKS